MKLTSKTISSPARTEKFPPPLMRFLRTNAGSRSSRRSRSSPMFVLRKKNTTTIETLEPSSPKVTCMGQVRAKRSSKSKSKSKQKQTPKTNRWWIKKPSPCRCRPVWPKWNFFRRKKPSKSKQDSVINIISECNNNFNLEEERVSVISVESVDNGFGSNSPPKNALLLTRCRSAPYRSSSLASRFWSSPLRSEETESTSVDDDDNDNEKSSSQSMQRESISDKEDSAGERIGSDLENVEELLLKRRVKKEEEEEECAVAVARPVVLTRCKSEPARVDYRIAPEVNINLWKKTRLGFAVTSSPLHIISD
ncbi:unnamed protein product [Trifolium pratense]|uniref:Uncharacterized protein n=1 Tax=Trifolium pratense TaxID=57577 RepID=A0ACB0IL46_TRIPR|nr:unnamed protein product [Trifolium pratense]